MANVRRKTSEADIYHITNRGTGRQIIFEDDEDRQRFLSLLHGACRDLGVAILAWCLMDNHYHLLLKGRIGTISAIMLKINSTYSRYFNKRHSRVGSLFQGRFGSTPICSEKQLVAELRYIHMNPQEAHVCSFSSYSWSSYREYLEQPKLTSVDHVLNIIGGKENFVAIHASETGAGDNAGNSALAEHGAIRTRINDEDMLEVAQSELGAIKLYDIKSLPKPERNVLLRRLYECGLSVRQIERLTGIGRSIISRASRM